MKGFLGDVTLKRISVTNYELVGDLTYSNEELSVTARHGLKTDGASVPRFMWRLIGSPFVGSYVCSAIIHDSLYASHKLNKEQTDKLFLEMMEVEGVSWWKRNAMYYAVKWFGADAWDKENLMEDYCEINFSNTIS